MVRAQEHFGDHFKLRWQLGLCGVVSDFLQAPARVIVLFVGSHRAWLQHLRLNYDVFQARGAPFAHVPEVVQYYVASSRALLLFFSSACDRCVGRLVCVL